MHSPRANTRFTIRPSTARTDRQLAETSVGTRTAEMQCRRPGLSITTSTGARSAPPSATRGSLPRMDANVAIAQAMGLRRVAADRGRARFAAVAFADADPRARRAPDESGGRLPDGQATREGRRGRGSGQFATRFAPPASRRICSTAALSNAHRRSRATRAHAPHSFTTGRQTTSPSKISRRDA